MTLTDYLVKHPPGQTECVSCLATGFAFDRVCRDCAGTGAVSEPLPAHVLVQAGLDPDMPALIAKLKRGKQAALAKLDADIQYLQWAGHVTLPLKVARFIGERKKCMDTVRGL